MKKPKPIFSEVRYVNKRRCSVSAYHTADLESLIVQCQSFGGPDERHDLHFLGTPAAATRKAIEIADAFYAEVAALPAAPDTDVPF